MKLKVKKSSFWQIWLVVTIFLSTVQDLKTVDYFGEIARNPIVFLTPLFLLTELVFLSKKHEKEFNFINLIFLIFIFLLFLSSLGNVSLWLFKEGTFIALGENIVVKSLKVITYYLSFMLLFRHTFFVMREIGDIKKVSKCFFIVTLLYIPILTFELYTIPTSFSEYHASIPPYYRVRLLTAESSWTGSVIVLLITGSLITYNNFRKHSVKFFIVIAFTLIYFTFTTSKMFLITVVMVSFIFILLRKKIKIKLLFISAFIFILSLFYVIPKVTEHIKSDLQNYTSVVTRTSSFINSFYVTLFYPLGTGGLYYAYFVEYVKEPAHLVASITGGRADEVKNWGKQDNGDKNISPSSELGQWTIMLGIPGFLLFFYFYLNLLNYSKVNNTLLLGMLYFFITGLLTETLMTKPNIIIFFALVVFCKVCYKKIITE
ncbi:O-antigen ligase family protein [Pontibacter harenae]|uniref:O-antigen ligase family protein n=1 Tax=Pontibacter harenae TaxID=2894083 RepID=UPI001E586C7E|nr:O-antigen ligase family protein [Pontibacter harenae]MCC9166592.1 O-antigen ligase family protein [Pontibacter harenae]